MAELTECPKCHKPSYMALMVGGGKCTNKACGYLKKSNPPKPSKEEKNAAKERRKARLKT